MHPLELQAHDAWDRDDLKAALTLFLAAERAGSTSCALNIGYFYDEGLSLPRSKSTAVRWYKRAIRLGDTSGATNIATICRDRHQRRLMFNWFRRACRQGDDGDAELDIAKCFAAGNGTIKSRNRALRHLRHALRSRHVTAAGLAEAAALRRQLVGRPLRRQIAIRAAHQR